MDCGLDKRMFVEQTGHRCHKAITLAEALNLILPNTSFHWSHFSRPHMNPLIKLPDALIEVP